MSCYLAVVMVFSTKETLNLCTVHCCLMAFLAVLCYKAPSPVYILGTVYTTQMVLCSAQYTFSCKTLLSSAQP